MADPSTKRARRGIGGWMAFVVMAFCVVGLTGLFATYALTIPIERAAARDAALDRVLAGADPATMRDALGGDEPGGGAAMLAGDPAGLPDRVRADRTAMHARIVEEAEAIAARLRWLVLIVTVMGAAFACAVMGSLAPPREADH